MTSEIMIISTKIDLENYPPSLIVPLSAGEHLPKALGPIADETGVPLSALQQEFKAELADMHTLYTGESRVHLLGLGKQAGFSETLKAFRSFAHQYARQLHTQIGISLSHYDGELPAAQTIEAAVNGLLLGTYQIGRFKTKDLPDLHPLRSAGAQLELTVPAKAKDDCQIAAERGAAIAMTQMRIMDLVNAPSNKKRPVVLAEWAQQSGEQHGYSVKVMDKAEIEATGLHALLAVNRGSEAPPFFIIMEYKPKEASGDLPKVGLVGKGVTFDTGGLSIKPSANMHYMKSDMGGAAAVLGTMEAAAKLQLPVHLIGIVPTTDNSVDAAAIMPSDVIDSYSGKTIEIIDTDAEGRLILADGLAYMTKHFQPDTLIDLATLTGSSVRTLGYHAAALFSNDDALAEQLHQASQRTGERVWRLPTWEVYGDELKSDVADIRNLGVRPMSGAITAAKFLEFFTADHPHWAHLDIAGVAFGDSEYTSQKSASGYGVRLLIDYLQHNT
jgi:leucyl aminopeptidase